MIGEEELNRRLRIAFRLITALHVFFLFHGANAQPPTTTGQTAPSSNDSLPPSNSSKTVVFAVVVSAFFLIGFLSVYIRHCSNPDPESSDRSFRRGVFWWRRGGLDASIVGSFPLFAYSSVKDIIIKSGTLECAVCLSEFEENETLRLLPRCSHVFHVDCIDSWLSSHVTCPVCRATLTPESVKLDEDDHAGTESSADPARLVSTESREPVERVRDHVVIDVVDDDRTVNSEAVGAALERGRRRSSGIPDKFPRSNSTGQLRNSTERYTLRLPEDMRMRIMAANSGALKRAMSYDAVLAAEGSTRRGHRSGGGRDNRVGSGGKMGSGQLYGPMGS